MKDVKLVYNIADGKILEIVPINQSLNTIHHNNPNIDSNELAAKILKHIPNNWKYCRFINGEFIPKSDLEINEIELYGRVLTSEERLLNKLIPSYGEIQKAENTIEILSILQEVL